MVVFCGLPDPQEKDYSARRIWIWILDIIFSHTRGMNAHAQYILRDNIMATVLYCTALLAS